MVATKLLKNKGATLVEYALLIALISVVCITSVSTIGRNARCTFAKVSLSIENARPDIPKDDIDEEGPQKGDQCP